MDETAVRDLLERIASEDAPPSRVRVALARSHGRRRIRLRRVYLPTAVAPIAAAVAVGLIASLSAGVHGGRAPVQATVRPRPINAPTRFNPVLPYASFGWLPAGYSVTGLANQTSQSTTQLGLTATSRVASFTVSLYPARYCSLTGPLTLAKTRYPQSLGCTGSTGAALPAGARVKPDLPLTGRAPDVNGQPAFTTVDGLAWEYGRGAWAILSYSYLPAAQNSERPKSGSKSALAGGSCISCKSQHGYSQYAKNLSAPTSAATSATLHRVAASIRYGVQSTVGYGFTISDLPPGWREGGLNSSYSVASIDGRLVNVGWTAGPAPDPSALFIAVSPAAIPGTVDSCNYVAGQSTYLRLDGARVMERTIDQPGKHWQYLCAPNVLGMQVLIMLDLANPNTNDTPLPGSRQLGSVLTVFSHLRLFGPDVKYWAASPLG